MGMAPLRVDILLDLKNLDFEECWKRRVESDLGGVAAAFISAADLINNKEADIRISPMPKSCVWLSNLLAKTGPGVLAGSAGEQAYRVIFFW
jgi:hypothetical protein